MTWNKKVVSKISSHFHSTQSTHLITITLILLVLRGQYNSKKRIKIITRLQKQVRKRVEIDQNLMRTKKFKEIILILQEGNLINLLSLRGSESHTRRT
jgi:hypothetical protein